MASDAIKAARKAIAAMGGVGKFRALVVDATPDVAVDRESWPPRLQKEQAICVVALAGIEAAEQADAPLTEPDGLLTDACRELWDECERNTIDEIVARVHPRGGDAVPEFWAWWEQHKGDWLGPHRAAGAWLREQRADAVRALVEACDAWMEHVDVMDATVIAAGGRPGTEQESAYRRIVSAARSTLRAVKGEKP